MNWQLLWQTGCSNPALRVCNLPVCNLWMHPLRPTPQGSQSEVMQILSYLNCHLFNM